MGSANATDHAIYPQSLQNCFLPQIQLSFQENAQVGSGRTIIFTAIIASPKMIGARVFIGVAAICRSIIYPQNSNLIYSPGAIVL